MHLSPLYVCVACALAPPYYSTPRHTTSPRRLINTHLCWSYTASCRRPGSAEVSPEASGTKTVGGKSKAPTAPPAAAADLVLKLPNGKPITSVSLSESFVEDRKVIVTVGGAADADADADAEQELPIDKLTNKVSQAWLDEHGMQPLARANAAHVAVILKELGATQAHLAALCGLHLSQQVGGGKNPDGDPGKFTKTNVLGVASLVAGAMLLKLADQPISQLVLLKNQTKELVEKAGGKALGGGGGKGGRRRSADSKLLQLKWWKAVRHTHPHTRTHPHAHTHAHARARAHAHVRARAHAHAHAFCQALVSCYKIRCKNHMPTGKDKPVYNPKCQEFVVK